MAASPQYFQASSLSPDAPVRVASCLDVPRAELARLVLASAGIPASLGNGNFLAWFWHYSNAVGGVTIYVRRRDVQRAREVLAAARADSPDCPPPWTCPSCGQRIGGGWDGCWQCGRWIDGTPGEPPAEDIRGAAKDKAAPRKSRDKFRVLALTGLVVLLVMLGRIAPTLSLLLATVVFVSVFLFRRTKNLSRNRQDDVGPPQEPQEMAEPDDSLAGRRSTTRSRVSRATVRRAWQAAVIAICAFAPLGFYSMWLLWKLMRRNTPLGWADRCRAWVAFFLNVSMVLYCFAIIGLLLFAFLRARH